MSVKKTLKDIFIILGILFFLFMSVHTLAIMGWGLVIGSVANETKNIIPTFSIGYFYSILTHLIFILCYYIDNEAKLSIKGQRILCITNILWLFLFLGFPFIYQNVPVIKSLCWCVEYNLFGWFYA